MAEDLPYKIREGGGRMADRPESSKQAAAPTTDWSLTAGSSTWNKLFDRYYRKKEVCWPLVPRVFWQSVCCPCRYLVKSLPHFARLPFPGTHPTTRF